MARWFIYDVQWLHNVPPLHRNLAIANRRIQHEDWDAPLLTAEGFVESVERLESPIMFRPRRWRKPLLTAEDVYRILYVSNANVWSVRRWECRCNNWDECDNGLTECSFRWPHRGEDAAQNDCMWFNEGFFRFEASRLHNAQHAYRNVPRFRR
jgi:hypothetical protein